MTSKALLSIVTLIKCRKMLVTKLLIALNRKVWSPDLIDVKYHLTQSK